MLRLLNTMKTFKVGLNVFCIMICPCTYVAQGVKHSCSDDQCPPWAEVLEHLVSWWCGHSLVSLPVSLSLFPVLEDVNKQLSTLAVSCLVIT